MGDETTGLPTDISNDEITEEVKNSDTKSLPVNPDLKCNWSEQTYEDLISNGWYNVIPFNLKDPTHILVASNLIKDITEEGLHKIILAKSDKDIHTKEKDIAHLLQKFTAY